MNNKTKEVIDNELQRCLDYVDDDEMLQDMCKNCEKWCGKEHDYLECLDRPCFTFYRCYRVLDLYHS